MRAAERGEGRAARGRPRREPTGPAGTRASFVAAPPRCRGGGKNSKRASWKPRPISRRSRLRSGCSSGVRISGVRFRYQLIAGLCPIGSMKRPTPSGFSTRRNSQVAFCRSRWWRIPVPQTTSNDASGNVMSSAFIRSNVAPSRPLRAASARATSIPTGEMSIPHTCALFAASSKASLPMPQPYSRIRLPAQSPNSNSS
jgi:hypothetical protein